MSEKGLLALVSWFGIGIVALLIFIPKRNFYGTAWYEYWLRAVPITLLGPISLFGLIALFIYLEWERG